MLRRPSNVSEREVRVPVDLGQRFAERLERGVATGGDGQCVSE